jgi:predicted DNA-binding ribbon-helix-helix protein
MKTSVRLTVALYDKVKTVADKRSTSVNVILNSAILAALGTL